MEHTVTSLKRSIYVYIMARVPVLAVLEIRNVVEIAE